MYLKKIEEDREESDKLYSMMRYSKNKGGQYGIFSEWCDNCERPMPIQGIESECSSEITVQQNERKKSSQKV